MQNYDRQQAVTKWRNDLAQLDRNGVPDQFSARRLAGLYAVASIAYHGNGRSLISDDTFDRLCHWLLENFEECRATGADMLDREMLKLHTGYRVDIFVKPYHDAVGMLLGQCQCIRCIDPTSGANAA